VSLRFLHFLGICRFTARPIFRFNSFFFFLIRIFVIFNFNLVFDFRY
jgi:hypothetical protein